MRLIGTAPGELHVFLDRRDALELVTRATLVGLAPTWTNPNGCLAGPVTGSQQKPSGQ